MTPGLLVVYCRLRTANSVSLSTSESATRVAALHRALVGADADQRPVRARRGVRERRLVAQHRHQEVVRQVRVAAAVPGRPAGSSGASRRGSRPVNLRIGSGSRPAKSGTFTRRGICGSGKPAHVQHRLLALAPAATRS